MTLYENLDLLGPRVLVRPLSELDVTAGGIIRPDVSRLPQNRAIVEKVGPGLTLDDGTVRPLPFAVGDCVFYQKFAGAWISLAEQERLMLMEDEIQAVLPKAHAALVHHDTDSDDHLEGEPCLICLKAKDAESKSRLDAMREELVTSPVRSAEPASSASA